MNLWVDGRKGVTSPRQEKKSYRILEVVADHFTEKGYEQRTRREYNDPYPYHYYALELYKLALRHDPKSTSLITKFVELTRYCYVEAGIFAYDCDTNYIADMIIEPLHYLWESRDAFNDDTNLLKIIHGIFSLFKDSPLEEMFLYRLKQDELQPLADKYVLYCKQKHLKTKTKRKKKNEYR